MGLHRALRPLPRGNRHPENVPVAKTDGSYIRPPKGEQNFVPDMAR